MERLSETRIGSGGGDDDPPPPTPPPRQLALPPGFRFHPTDDELITHYLSTKVVDRSFRAAAIGEVDLNKCEPWELPWKAKMGEKEWYFFCIRDRKYPTGLRTNRATVAGYWKATGKDKEIYGDRALVGMKKTLVFYKGRAPKGEKSNWVMHEYRLDGKYSHRLPKSAKNEWVICRIFKKSAGGKKIPIQGLLPCGGDQPSSVLPPLTDTSPGHASGEPPSSHVTCFSNPAADYVAQASIFASHPGSSAASSSFSLNPPVPISMNSLFSAKTSLPPFFNSNLTLPEIESFLAGDGTAAAEQSISKMLSRNYGAGWGSPGFSLEAAPSADGNTEMSSGVSNRELAPEDLGVSGGPVDLQWNYY